MANWQRKLDIVDAWNKAQEHEIAPCELAAVIAKKLKELAPFGSKLDFVDDAKNELIDVFEDIATEEDLEFEDFNYHFNDLYDWADMKLDDDWNGKKVCWIKTF